MFVFDEKIYPHMYNFKNKQHYYEEITIAEHADNIKVPTFALESLDDQICPQKFMPVKFSEGQGSTLCLAATSFGAHVCHIEGTIIPKLFYTKPIMEFFNYLEARKTFEKKDK